MKKTSLLVGASIVLCASPILAEENVVRVYNWSDYIDNSLLEKFETETGIKLVYDVFDSNEMLETKMLAGSSGYDVVVPTDSFLGRQIQAGVFQKLDQEKLPNSQYSWDVVLERTEQFDPGNAYSVNYMWGTTGIAVNVDKVRAILGEDAKLNSWSLVFDPEIAKQLSECGIYFLDSPTDILPAALAYLGEDPTSHDPDVIAKTESTLMAVRPYIQKFHSSESVNALANGDICVAVAWSGDMLQARDRAEEAGKGVVIEYHIPLEGSQMWFDQMAIPADAPNPDAAHAFINFMMDPENIAVASNYINYANGNSKSHEFLDESVLNDPAIYPDAETMKKLFVITAADPKLRRIMTRLWTRVKSGT